MNSGLKNECNYSYSTVKIGFMHRSDRVNPLKTYKLHDSNSLGNNLQLRGKHFVTTGETKRFH